MNVEKVKSYLQKDKKIVITSHKSPDGDAIGSSMSLYNILQNRGVDCSVIVPNVFPNFLTWIKNTDKIVVVDEQAEVAKKLVEDADVIFTLDYNALHRVDELGEWIGASKAFKIMIDHHQHPEDYADVCVSNIEKSSTCEMMYDFYEDLGFLEDIDEAVAEAIYTGLVTDTGSFKHNGTKAHTHMVAAKLIEKGLDNARVHTLLFDNNSISRIKVLGYCLDKMEVLEDLECAVIHLPQQVAYKLNMQKGDSEGIVNFGLSLSCVKCAVFFREDGDKIKISFRSKSDFDISIFAKDYFSGGGHKNASGGISYLSMEDTIKKFKSSFKEYLANYNELTT